MFNKGQRVKFAIKHAHGIIRGNGIVKKLVPKGATRGDARLTVITGEGKVYKPYPTQCKAS